jgi:hypothetical protein
MRGVWLAERGDAIAWRACRSDRGEPLDLTVCETNLANVITVERRTRCP